VLLVLFVWSGVPAPARAWGATVKLQIVKGGRVVKIVSVGSKPTNVVLTCRFKITRRKGTCTWRVLATDAACNKAVDTLAVKLTVKSAAGRLVRRRRPPGWVA
jgi:hypothetical protein